VFNIASCPVQDAAIHGVLVMDFLQQFGSVMAHQELPD
jgi:hypothetical protein